MTPLAATSIFSSNPSPTIERDKDRNTFWVIERTGPIVISRNGTSTPDCIRVFTNDCPRLQRELPFSLILPNLIPSDLQLYPPTFDATVYPIGSSDIEVKIQYETHTTQFKYVSITEIYPREQTIFKEGFYAVIGEGDEKIRLFQEWDDQNHEVLWDNNGILILEYTQLPGLLPEEELEQIKDKFFSYDFNWNSIDFNVYVQGYERSESRNIVSSLFEQSSN